MPDAYSLLLLLTVVADPPSLCTGNTALLVDNSGGADRMAIVVSAGGTTLPVLGVSGSSSLGTLSTSGLASLNSLKVRSLDSLLPPHSAQWGKASLPMKRGFHARGLARDQLTNHHHPGHTHCRGPLTYATIRAAYR